MRALGIDLGSSRIGLALSDAGGVIASPFLVLKRSRSAAHDRAEIARIARDEEVEILVVGLPLLMSGAHGPAARAATEEARKLATVVDVPVVLHDERLTTVSADRAMIEGGLRAPERRQVVDKIAAAIMLQSWLDARRASES